MANTKAFNITRNQTIGAHNENNGTRNKERRARLKKPLDMKEPADKKRVLSATRTKCTEKLIVRFCDLVSEGIPASTICNYLGITGNAFHAWIRKGTEYLDNDGNPAEFEVYGKFVQAYHRAGSEYLIRRHRILHGTHDKNWYREVVILERRDKKNWSKDAPQGGGDENYQVDEKFV